MVEIALFPDYPSTAIYSYAWHVHVIVWNTTYRRLNAALKKVRVNTPSFVPGTPSAVCRPYIDKNAILAKWLYMIKTPLSRYRVGISREREVVDRCTGEVVPKHYVRKDELRTGQRVRLCRAFAGLSLAKLLFGHGNGKNVARAINIDSAK